MALRLAGEGYVEGVTEFLGLSDTPGSYSGQGDKYAKVNAAENALEFGAPAGGFDIFDKFREFIPWVSLDGFATGGVGTPTIQVRVATVLVQTDMNENDEAYVRTTTQYYKINESGKKVTVEFILVSLPFGTEQNIWLRLNKSGVLSETDDHFGWKIIGTDLYASNADGTTQKITDTTVNLSTGSQRTRLKIVLNPGTDCKFYVNDELKVTHTENLPDYENLELKVHVKTLTAMARAIEVGRVLMEKEN